MNHFPELSSQTCIDRDGNVIRKGMSVVSGGETWVVGYASKNYVRIDRPMTTVSGVQSRLVGRKKLSCIHLIGFTAPLMFRNGNNPHIEP